jgi:hypothetical protein
VIFNDSLETRRYNLAEPGFADGVMELLHPMGFIDKELILGPHDGALIAAK